MIDQNCFFVGSRKKLQNKCLKVKKRNLIEVLNMKTYMENKKK